MQIAIKKFTPERIPTSPGLYFFIGPGGKILYVGKAANLRQRLRSYFAERLSEKIMRLRRESTALRILPLASEIEALVKEAAYIKRSRPKYNILLRDDKNYFFVGFTKEPFPRIFVTHQPKQFRNAEFLGPYVSGRALKTTLRLLRRVFSYCTCPAAHSRICLQEQLGLCPGYCCRKNAAPTPAQRRAYAKQIVRIKRVLSGRSASLKKELERELRDAVEDRRFEDAARIRDELRGLNRILEHRGLLLPIETKDAAAPSRTFRLPHRIECYDASVISGSHAVGAMSVFVNGRPLASAWRRFSMRRRGRPNDPAQIEEMISRRLAHREWPLPDLIIVDGGVAQLAAARRAVAQSGYAIPVVAIAKGKARNDRLLQGDPPTIQAFADLPQETAAMLRRIRDATHRFVLAYHRTVRRKSVFGKIPTKRGTPPQREHQEKDPRTKDKSTNLNAQIPMPNDQSNPKSQ